MKNVEKSKLHGIEESLTSEFRVIQEQLWLQTMKFLMKMK